MQCPKCNGQVWDNIAKKANGTFTDKGPDYTCKNKCGWAYWPNDQKNQPPVGGAPAQGAQQPAQQQNKTQQTSDGPDWDAINARDQMQIHWGEAFKLASQGFGDMSGKLPGESIDIIYANARNLYSRLHDMAPWNNKPQTEEPPQPTNMPPAPGDDLPF